MPNAIETVHLAPHDPVPAGAGKHVVVLHQMGEDDPDKTVTVISLSGPAPQSVHPMRPDGTAMTLDEAVEAAKQVAATEKVGRVYVIDRTQGQRESDILQHGGDHSVHMDELVDSDAEEGERGTDMRDRAP